MELLFCQLKIEILEASSDIEEIFSLVSELRDGVERNFRLKKLFWKTPELLDFLVKKLLDFLPNSPNPLALTKDDAAKELRADELELVILVTETIAVMFRETEVVPCRILSLNSGAGVFVKSLLTAISTLPEVPEKRPSISHKIHCMTGKVRFDHERCLADVELVKLIEEFTNTATTVLFELIIIAKQHPPSENNVIHTAWIVKTLKDLGTLENFVERMVTHAMKLLSPSQFDELSPQEIVLVFQQFTVLQCLMEFSPCVTLFMRKQFYEEFQYYIQTPILKKKLPRRYLLTPTIFTLIQEVVSEVLEKKRIIKV